MCVRDGSYGKIVRLLHAQPSYFIITITIAEAVNLETICFHIETNFDKCTNKYTLLSYNKMKKIIVGNSLECIVL